MPLYAYRCTECGHEFEARQRMTDDPLSECPACSGAVRRVINQVGVVFKGSGFYITDSKNKKTAAPVSSSESESTKPQPESGDASAKQPEKESKPAKTKAATEASTN